MKKEKRLILNKRGETLLFIIFGLAIVTAAADCESLTAFIISKVVALVLIAVSAILMRYLKED